MALIEYSYPGMGIAQSLCRRLLLNIVIVRKLSIAFGFVDYF